MARNSSPSRKGGQQAPFEIVLDEGCSIICDEVPVNCTIRVLPVDGRSPPRMSPVSQWLDDYPSGGPSEGGGGEDWGPPPRDKYGNLIGSPISSPPSPMRFRRSIVDNARRNIPQNSGGGATSSEGIHRGFREGEYDIFAFRKPYCKHESQSPSASSSSFTSASSYNTFSSREPSPPPAEQRAASTDRLLNSNRPQMAFKRTNIQIDSTDLREMHPSLNPSPVGPPQPQSAPSSSRLSPSSPLSPSRGPRCCGMADYNRLDYGSNTPDTERSKSPETERSKTPEAGPSKAPDTEPSKPPERDSGGAAVSDSVYSAVGEKCTYHDMLPCPSRAGCRCRENRAGQSPPPASRMQGGSPCKYHNALPCPARAGVPCRNSIIDSRAGVPCRNSIIDSASVLAATAAASASEVAPPGHLRTVAPAGHFRISVRASLTGASSPGQRPPWYPGGDARSQSLPEISPGPDGADVRNNSSPESSSRPGSAAVAYPPKTIAPPPTSPRSKTPSRRPKCKGVCL